MSLTGSGGDRLAIHSVTTEGASLDKDDRLANRPMAYLDILGRGQVEGEAEATPIELQLHRQKGRGAVKAGWATRSSKTAVHLFIGILQLFEIKTGVAATNIRATSRNRLAEASPNGKRLGGVRRSGSAIATSWIPQGGTE